MDVSMETSRSKASMDTPVVWLAALSLAACASPVSTGDQSPDPDVAPDLNSQCYIVNPAAEPAPDVSLPRLIELSEEPAPGYTEPGRLAVREPGVAEPKAPISSWRRLGPGTIELALGGGFTGYVFTLRQAIEGGWVGSGSYFADFGVEPAPPRLGLTLDPQSCP
jgi:hypothetical protein